VFRTKKGLSADVDWIIATAMFLIYLGSIFVIFKPGVRPVFEEESLLNIVQRNFDENISWSISKTPIFLTPISFSAASCVPSPSVSCKTSDLGGGYYLSLGGEYHNDQTKDKKDPFLATIYPTLSKDQIAKQISLYYIPPRSATSPTGSGYAIVDVTGFATGNAPSSTTSGKPCTSDSDCDSTNTLNPTFCVKISDDPPSTSQCKSLSEITCTSDSDCHTWKCKEHVCIPDSSKVTATGTGSSAESRSNQNNRGGQATATTGTQTDQQRHAQDKKKDINTQYDQQGRAQSLAEDSLKFDVIDQKNLIFKTNKIDAQREYLLVSSTDVINPVGGELLVDPTRQTNAKVACILPDYKDPCVLPDCNPQQQLGAITRGGCKVKYDLGSTEVLAGVSTNRFIDLDQFTLSGSSCSAGYVCVKEKWGFPSIREFQIQIEDARNDPSLNLFSSFPDKVLRFPDNKVIPLEARVKVRQFNSFVLTPDGLKIPITVTLKVW